MWASSGPFPLSAHYGLYKRGRDPPTNPSRHLKKSKAAISISSGCSRKIEEGDQPPPPPPPPPPHHHVPPSCPPSRPPPPLALIVYHLRTTFSPPSPPPLPDRCAAVFPLHGPISTSHPSHLSTAVISPLHGFRYTGLPPPPPAFPLIPIFPPLFPRSPITVRDLPSHTSS